MALSSIVRNLQRAPLTNELLTKLNRQEFLHLNGIGRLPKGLVTSALAKASGRNLCVICATLEEASRWSAQLEMMDWAIVHLYPSSEASPYEPFDPESEITWGQMQVLADLVTNHPSLTIGNTNNQPPTNNNKQPIAIVATHRAIQPHLPPIAAFAPYCITLNQGMVWESKKLDQNLVSLGYKRVASVETEGEWSRRGDIVDIFPVAAELPVRLEWFGDELEKLREFDPSTQRSLDQIEQLVLTPTDFSPIITEAFNPEEIEVVKTYLSPEEETAWQVSGHLEGSRRFLRIPFQNPASLLDYLPPETIIAIDEPDQCRAHCARALEYVKEQLTSLVKPLPSLHCSFDESIKMGSRKEETNKQLPIVFLSELVETTIETAVNLSSRPLPTNPHQFAKLAEIIRGKQEIYGGISLKNFSIWLVSAQPSRSVSLLQEHDCPAQFVPNSRDFPAIDRLQIQKTPIAVKYSGFAELEGFVIPTFRIALITDREFFGQHSLATPNYIRKRRRAASKQIDPNKLSEGDYVVHKSNGVGKFIRLESLTIDYQTREYLVLQYADGLLRVAADQVGVLSRFRSSDSRPPQLNKMSGKSWESNKNRVRKAIKKLAVDLLKLYAQRSQKTGYAFPEDSPWQQELEDSFPYQATPDQLKAVQDVKRDMMSDRPMDRLVCGDVGFGKTEVAIRAIFKAVTAGKQVAFLAPTTILTQQHYHTLKERFAPYPIHVGLLNRFRTASECKDIQRRLATGELDVVVGTHQLLSNEVKFRDLGMLVIDEEQRFGVNQKEKIKSMKTQVDVLTLSATPIPRTLYMSLSGVREMSLITTPPPSRRPIKTHLSPYDAEAIRTAIRMELDRGGQVFYVVPRIEGIEELGTKLIQTVPGVRLAIAHGQMPESELESTMLAFSNGEADILVCTTIIESGLDIPRVNTILIEDAHKFGLSQLYQLRGRVGRAGIQAHAWLFYPKHRQLSETARQRLRAIQEFTQLGSGYHLATRDMEIRGVGSLLGAEQSGQMEAIGFDLYMEMLQEAIKEIQGQEIPKVDDTQIDLNLTAFIPADYIPDVDQKMTAYRTVAAATSQAELEQIALDWNDRYGPIPSSVQQLLRVLQLKQIAKSLGFSRIKSEGKQHVILETPMEEPAWNILAEKLPKHLRSRFVYTPGKVTVRGLGIVKPDQQLKDLINFLGKMQGALPEIGE
ncbi:MAG TPA: transcription-repair coupling factor [Cyanobacteria bacterium UBA11149]|nr:transcription-repair coupling factor [Cyanobacteria bacterium UBA11367]HBE56974.1 transcription-repair coupling factor [Cyanobacteria bacterium UBA11366]HBK65074.1 transcription-repair coupling factor [Cyanobacteria bacterium UBA11166]HBR72224.1 transcription-repair coupling factor [Cyanobacteria bacterium UBA11159]HBS72457.1 transcription-repair coupling factor [Cyanobacteria bacterium UBA11153]HBW91665.1 transcription-repair coupling factor [Cyanobacteria bacterium UBA11149]HCA95647.1 tr